MIQRIFILIGYFALSCSLYFCDSDDDCRIITEIDMEEMANLHLPDFHLVRESAKDSVRTEYVFSTENESVRLWFDVGLFQSEKDVQDFANHFVNTISVYVKEGPHQGVSIGDKYWLSSPYDANNYNDIIFIRKNVFITIFSPEYENLKILTTNIDNDILNNASYINCIN